MRIITGKYRGRVMRMPGGIRPTQNRVRKAIFDILGDISGLSFLELFAGSGAVGFEAVSRGVAKLALVEDNRDCQLVIQKNLESLKPEGCVLYPREAIAAIGALHKEKRKFDIVFLDPPYCKRRALRLRSGSRDVTESYSLSKKALQSLGAYDILAPNGLIVIQHFGKDSLPENIGKIFLFKQAKYGDTVLSFYRKKVD